MQKIKAFIEAEAILLVAVLLAAVISIAGTSLVLGAIPDNNGQIHACRANDTGVVRIIDTESESCTGSETQIDWNQYGNPTLHDANGQLIGNIIDSRSENVSSLVVYNPSLNRIMNVDYSEGAGRYAIVSGGNSVFYESNDCTGQPYVTNDPRFGLKTELFRTGDSSYGVVADNASSTTKTVSSLAQYDSSSDSFNCVDIDDSTDNFYPITSASLPFTTPLAGPFKL